MLFTTFFLFAGFFHKQHIRKTDVNANILDSYCFPRFSTGKDKNQTEKSKISHYPGNKYYWQVDGKPVLLLGGSSAPKNLLNDEGMFLWPNVTESLDKLKRHGGNYARCLMSGRLRDDYLWPFKRIGDKYDLDQWDDTYWQLLETYLKATSGRDIITDIEIWATFDYARMPWTKNPFNPQNNVNYTEEETGIPAVVEAHPVFAKNIFYQTIPAKRNIVSVLKYQQKFVEKILSYTLKYNHVLYCMDNELGTNPEWSAYWAGYIRQLSEKAGKRVFLTEMFNAHDLGDSIYDNVTMHPEIYDFMEISQNNHQTGQIHYDHIQVARSRISGNPRPLSNIKIYGADENRFGSTKDATERFWRIIFGGCASARFHEKHLGDTEIALQMVQSAREVISSFGLFQSFPDNQLLLDRESNEAYCLANPGKEYAVYFPESGDVHLDITGFKGTVKIRWYNIDEGRWERSSLVKNNDPLLLKTPGNGQWAAIIHVIRSIDNNPMSLISLVIN